MADIGALNEALAGRYVIDREIRITATLQHPHILTLIDSGEAKGQR